MDGKDKFDFTSGASSSGNIPPYECLTLTFLRRCAFRMKLGMHYGKHNWKKGTNDKKFILERLGHAVEHLHKAMEQIDTDGKMVDDDLSAVAVNCMFAMEYQEWYNLIARKLSEARLEHQGKPEEQDLDLPEATRTSPGLSSGSSETSPWSFQKD